jgi:DNA-binding transcriptional MerR regulator
MSVGGIINLPPTGRSSPYRATVVSMFTVGQFADLAGVSAKVLRAYDEAGLFTPAWVDPWSSYRYYSPAQLPGLRRILALRDVGMGLAEIGELVRGGADLRAALDRRRAALEHERRDIERRLAALDIRVALADGDSTDPDVVVRRIPAEPVATFDLAHAPDGDVGAAFYALESYVRDAGARAHRPPGSIDDEGLIYVPIRRALPPTERIGTRRLPAGQSATLLHRGDYDTLPAARRALVTWSAAAGYAPAGPMRTLYLQFGAEPELRVPRAWVVEDVTAFVTELQLPVA